MTASIFKQILKAYFFENVKNIEKMGSLFEIINKFYETCNPFLKHDFFNFLANFVNIEKLNSNKVWISKKQFPKKGKNKYEKG